MKPPDSRPPEDWHATDVEEHVKSCPDCSAKSAGLDRMIDSLAKHKEIFCPEPWQLYEFADTGNDVEGKLARHIEGCASCAERLHEYRRSAIDPVAMPQTLLEAFREHAAQEKVACQTDSDGPLKTIHDFFSSIFQMPVFLVGAAAAAILAVVLLYPRVDAPPQLALSDVTWKSNLGLMGARPTSGDASKPRVAAVVMFDGLQAPWPQDQIDEIYWELRPTRRMRKHLSFVSPEQVKKMLGGVRPRSSVEKVAEKLRADKSADHLLVLTVKPVEDRMDILGRVINCATGETLGEVKDPAVERSNLTSHLKNLSIRLGSLILEPQSE